MKNISNKEKKNEKKIKEPVFKKQKIDKIPVLKSPMDFKFATDCEFVTDEGLFSAPPHNKFLSFCIKSDVFQNLGQAVYGLRKDNAYFTLKKHQGSFYFTFFTYFSNLYEFINNEFVSTYNEYIRVINSFGGNAVLLNLADRFTFISECFSKFINVDGLGSLRDNPCRLVRFYNDQAEVSDDFFKVNDRYYSVLKISRLPFYDSFNVFDFIYDFHDVCDASFLICPFETSDVQNNCDNMFVEFNSWQGKIERKDMQSAKVFFMKDNDVEDADCYFSGLGISLVISGVSVASLKENINSIRNELLNKGFDVQKVFGIYKNPLFELNGFSFDFCPVINIKTSLLASIFGTVSDTQVDETDSEIRKLFGF